MSFRTIVNFGISAVSFAILAILDERGLDMAGATSALAGNADEIGLKAGIASPTSVYEGSADLDLPRLDLSPVPK